MKLIAAMDLMQGQVVRGIGGKRENYRPIISKLVPHSHPVTVAQAFRNIGLKDLYIADLDALAGCDPCMDILQELSGVGLNLWVDSGSKDLESLHLLDAVQPYRLVAGYETWGDPETLPIALREYSQRLVFSMDLRNGKPMAEHPMWECSSPWEIIEKVALMGIRQIMVMDVARVGMGNGLGSLELCSRLKKKFPDCLVYSGGGARGIQDLDVANANGVDGVVLASALHDQRVCPTDLAAS